MFCWSCGHENHDDQKFCGECGRSLYKPEKVVREFMPKNVARTSTAAPTTTSEQAASSPVSAAPSGTMLTPPAPPATNPLIEEPRVIHEDPIAEAKSAPPLPPTPIRDRIPNRITGPSFLGLSDSPSSSESDDSSYLLYDEPESRSPWGTYIFLALLVIVSLLVIRNWQDVRAMATNYSQRLGMSDAPKPPAGPQRVTASNDASQMTPDAAPEEGKSSTPAEQPAKPATNDSAKPQQTAKLDKPQTDETPADKAASPNDSAESSSAKPAPTKEATTPAPDNSQLEEAQKYLQGRGVPQDCNRGLDLLRSAAKQPNAKARIQMAALYETGHCVTPDPAVAYSWFARAQEVEPRNKLIERNLDSLWARMSDEDRRKVLR